MKKIILLIVLFFNLIPVLKEGKIRMMGAFEALANEENGNELPDYDQECGPTICGENGVSNIGCFTYIYATSCVCQTSGEFIGDQLLYMYSNGSCNEENPGGGGGGGGEDDDGDEDEEESGCPDGMIDSYCGCVWDISECEEQPQPVDCANVPGGSATTDDCNTCVEGTTGKTKQTWYKDDDNDTWGNSSNTKSCYNPGSGWVTRGGDNNDNCKNFENEADQCPSCSTNNTTYDVNSATTSAGAPPSQPLWSGIWGLTLEENVEIDISACYDSGKWNATLVKLKGNYSIQTRLLPGVSEVTGPSGNTTSGNFCDQVGDLKATSTAWGSWFMLNAIMEHEKVHASHFTEGLKQVAPEIELLIEDLSVTFNGQTKEQAIEEIKGLSGYDNVLNQAKNKWFNKNSTLIIPDHGISGDSYVAERNVLIPMASIICNHAITNNWPTCTKCP